MAGLRVSTLPDGDVVGIEPPEGWEVTAAPQVDLPLVAAGPVGARPFRPSLVLSVDRLAPGVGLGRWQQAVEPLLPRQLDHYLLIDAQPAVVAGRPGARRLATHRSPDGDSLMAEQWLVVAGGFGLTLTGTAATPLYPEVRPVLFAAAATLTIEPPDADRLVGPGLSG